MIGKNYLRLFLIAHLVSPLTYLISPRAFSYESVGAPNHGVTAFNEGRYQEAEVYFVKQLEDSAHKNDSLIYLSRIAMETGKAAESTDYIEEALKLPPTDIDEIILSGDVYCNQATQSSVFSALKLAKKCIAQYETAVRIAPDNPNALLSAARYYFEAPVIAGGSTKKGEAFLTHLSDVSPEDANIYRVFLLDTNGDTEAALKLADELRKTEISSTRNQYELARFYRDKTLYGKAAPLFESVQSQPLSAQNKWYINDSLLQLGEILLAEKRDLLKSIELIERYKERNDNPHDKHYFWSTWSLAQAYKASGNLDRYNQLVKQIQSENYKKDVDFAKRFEAGIKTN